MMPRPWLTQVRPSSPDSQKGKPTAKVWDLAIGSHGSNTGDDHITDQPDHTNARREIKPTCALRGNNPRR